MRGWAIKNREKSAPSAADISGIIVTRQKIWIFLFGSSIYGLLWSEIWPDTIFKLVHNGDRLIIASPTRPVLQRHYTVFGETTVTSKKF